MKENGVKQVVVMLYPFQCLWKDDSAFAQAVELHLESTIESVACYSDVSRPRTCRAVLVDNATNALDTL